MSTKPNAYWDDAYDSPSEALEAPGTTRRLEFGPLASQVANIRATKLARILRRLREGPASTWDLCHITPAYSQRMGDLRRLGFKIMRQDHVGPDQEYSLYVLTGEPKP